jgi:hypothetical protein
MATDHANAAALEHQGTLALVPRDVVDQVVEMTRQLFPGPLSVKTSRDPDDPRDEFIVLSVEAEGDVSDILDRECQWIHRVAAAVPGLGKFRLSVDPR